MYQITGTKYENSILDTNLSNKELTEEFATFFMAKITKIWENLQHVPLYDPEERNIFTIRSFESVAHEEMKRAIIDLATKTCELDVIQTKLFKDVLDSNLFTYIAQISTVYGNI